MRLFDPSTSRAVLIGMGRYDALPPLQGVENNLRGLSELLTSPEIGRLPQAHLRVLDHRADRIAIGKALIKMGIVAQDMFLVYFAGHGLVDPDTGELFLAMPETDPGVPPGFSALPYRAFAALVRESSARAKIVILDCCFSGRAAVPLMADSGQALVDQLHIEGTGILTACPPNQPALDGPEYTIFTGMFLSILHEGIPGEEPFLSLGAIYRCLRREMMFRDLPKPQFFGTANVHELALARNRAYRPPAPTVERISVEWAIYGKPPGSKDDYRVMHHSANGLEAKDVAAIVGHFWTGGTDPTEPSAPQIVFSHLRAEDDIMVGLTVHQLSPELDAVGRPITTTRHFSISQRQLCGHRVSYLELWKALQDAGPPRATQESLYRVVRTADLEAIDSDIAAFGTATIERTVALISSGQAVTVLGASHRTLDERIRFIDAVLQMLPDDVRFPFSAATWCSALLSRNTIRLAFSDRVREGTARVDWDATPSTPDAATEIADLIAEAEAPDAALPHRGMDALAPLPRSPPPKRLGALAARIAEAEAFFAQTLDRTRREAEERYKDKTPRPEKPPTWWKRWKRRILRLLSINDGN